MNPDDFCVVIAALNEQSRIATAIESAFTCGAARVIVSDGGSDDETAEVARRSGAEVVKSSRGRGQQLRLGAEQATEEMLLFLHADNWLEADCLEAVCQLVAKRRSNAPLWGGFRQAIEADHWQYRLLEWGNACRIRVRGIPFGDQAIFVQRRLYEQAGGIEPLPLMEDVILSRTLRRQSWPVLIDARVHVDARRWQKRGVVRQTLRNWGIQLAHRLGVSEDRLAGWYR